MTAQRLALHQVKACVRDGSTSRCILDIPELELPPGSLVGIRGASGAGKTTLLRLLAGLRLPDEGRVCWGETDISVLPEAQRDAWRGRTLGFVFQDFQLLPTLSALENVLLPATFRNMVVPLDVRVEAMTLLLDMGVSHFNQRAATLSRGEQQRVAVARALLFQPALILADEPTASLDAEHGKVVMDALVGYACTQKATLCVVSHEQTVLEQLPCCLGLERGGVTMEVRS